MLHFRSLDVYRLSISFVTKAYSLAEHCDRDLANQLRRQAVAVMTHIATDEVRIARNSALQAAAILDAMRALDVPARTEEADALIGKIVAAL